MRTQAALHEVSQVPSARPVETGVLEDAVVAHIMSGSFSEVPPRETDGASSSALPFRVLLGQYDADDRAELRRVLDGDARFQVWSEAADAPATIAATLRRLPDLCLLDVALPGGGVEAAWEISARLPNTKVVLRTDDCDDEELKSEAALGGDGTLIGVPSAALDDFRSAELARPSEPVPPGLRGRAARVGYHLLGGC